MKWFLFIILLFSQPWLMAQEMLGLSQSNYSGVHSILSNPAMLTNTRSYFDVNFIGLDFFAQNNFIYIPGNDYNVWKAMRQEELPTYGDDNHNFLYYKNQRNKFAITNLRILGPSAMIDPSILHQSIHQEVLPGIFVSNGFLSSLTYMPL